MNILRNTLAVLVGLVLGSVVNMGLIVLGPSLIPPPVGVNVDDLESIAASIHLYEVKHFIFPFLAHSLGTLIGALVAFLVAASHREAMAWVIGVATLAGGIFASVVIPAPTWYIAVDLLLAYLPMTYLAILLGRRLGAKAEPTP